MTQLVQNNKRDQSIFPIALLRCPPENLLVSETVSSLGELFQLEIIQTIYPNFIIDKLLHFKQGLVIFNIDSSKQIEELVRVLVGLSNLITSDTVRVCGFLNFQDERLEELLKKKGCHEIISDKTSPKALTIKLQRAIRHLQKRAEDRAQNSEVVIHRTTEVTHSWDVQKVLSDEKSGARLPFSGQRDAPLVVQQLRARCELELFVQRHGSKERPIRVEFRDYFDEFFVFESPKKIFDANDKFEMLAQLVSGKIPVRFTSSVLVLDAETNGGEGQMVTVKIINPQREPLDRIVAEFRERQKRVGAFLRATRD